MKLLSSYEIRPSATLGADPTQIVAVENNGKRFFIAGSGSPDSVLLFGQRLDENELSNWLATALLDQQ